MSGWTPAVFSLPGQLGSRALDLMFLGLRVQNAAEIVRRRGSGERVIWRLRNGATFAVEAGSSDMLAIREVMLRNVYPLRRAHYGLVVDIGAHLGSFAARISSCADRVVAFEPVERNFNLLRDYCASPKHNIECHRLAVTGHGGMVQILTNPTNSGQHSIYGDLKPGGGIERVESIGSPDLLEFLGASEIDMLKIDAEGAEYEICQAAPELLRATREVIIEANAVDEIRLPERLAGALREAGFSITNRINDKVQRVFHGVRRW